MCLDIKHIFCLESVSCVNLMVGCILFILSMKSRNSSSVPDDIMKMSSINLFQICMFLLFCLTSSVSSVPINRFAYEGAILVPMVYHNY